MSVDPSVLRLTRGEVNLMRGMGWFESVHQNAATYLLRDVARRKNFGYHGLFYFKDLLHHPRRHRFRNGVPGGQILHKRRNEDDSGDRWILTDWNENQLYMYDSFVQKDPEIVGHLLVRVQGLIPGPRGTKITAFYPRVQQQSNGYDCGPHAIASAVEIVSGNNNAASTNFNRDMIRSHICKIKNRLTDAKLELEERENKMEMEVQKAIGDLCRIQSENKELLHKRDCIRKEAPLIEQEWDQKLDAVRERREEANQRHRFNKDNKAYKVEEYHGRTAKLKEAITAAQNEVDRAYCKLRAVDEVSESVKDIHRNVTHKHAKQAQIMEDMKAQTGNFEKDATERNVRLNQKYRDKENEFEQAVRKAEKELAEAIEGLKKQETVYENFANEKATVERSADQVFIDAKNAEKLLIRVQNRLHDEKQKLADVEGRYKCVLKFKERLTAAGITPHLYLDKIRQQIKDATMELEALRSGC
ncbi:hypothetical protein RvY_00090 [Ramazzottius varieornatus]|uniref:Ubiquitin-like protease family profile domain-containing protein n=1 Tax=Ramazzottius varieornatus TaxID=947166 RepID=A0A1D1UIZ8_RAMVA|nr:hypothetical protein RvY_00090 [Ramazzottius varieornatus]